jgi:hypothetical protein
MRAGTGQVFLLQTAGMIYLFPGLAASEKLFQGYAFPGFESRVITYLIPAKNEPLHQYCLRLASGIDPDPENIYIGVSFGGILAHEIARFLPPKKIVIISGMRAGEEPPGYFRWLRRFPIHHILPAPLIKAAGVAASRLFGRRNEEEKEHFWALVKEASPQVIKWCVRQTIDWKGPSAVPKVVHIHGDRDIVFPVRSVKPDYVIKGGRHFMVMREVSEIQALLMRLITSDQGVAV